MKQTRRVAALNALFLALGGLTAGASVTSSRPGHRQRPPETGTTSLVGTWRQLKGNFNGRPFVVPEGRTIIKMHTAKHYVFIDVDNDGKLVDLTGGTYTLTGNRYQTMPAFGFGGAYDRVKGHPQSFEAKVDGNTWYHEGTLTGGLTLDEVWERVD